MPSPEKTLEFAREKGYDKLLSAFFRDNCSFDDVMLRLNKTKQTLDLDIRVMCALELTEIMRKEQGGYALVLKELGQRLIE